jgi:hypothetical protein
MPKPRPIANTAKTIIETVTNELKLTNADFFRLTIYIEAGNKSEAHTTLQAIARTHNLAIETLNFLGAGAMDEAQDVLMDAKLRRGKGTEQ